MCAFSGHALRAKGPSVSMETVIFLLRLSLELSRGPSDFNSEFLPANKSRKKWRSLREKLNFRLV